MNQNSCNQKAADTINQAVRRKNTFYEQYQDLQNDDDSTNINIPPSQKFRFKSTYENPFQAYFEYIFYKQVISSTSSINGNYQFREHLNSENQTRENPKILKKNRQGQNPQSSFKFLTKQVTSLNIIPLQKVSSCRSNLSLQANDKAKLQTFSDYTQQFQFNSQNQLSSSKERTSLRVINQTQIDIQQRGLLAFNDRWIQQHSLCREEEEC